MVKKEEIYKQFLNNLKEENVDGEIHRIFKFIINKNKIKKFKENELK